MKKWLNRLFRTVNDPIPEATATGNVPVSRGDDVATTDDGPAPLRLAQADALFYPWMLGNTPDPANSTATNADEARVLRLLEDMLRQSDPELTDMVPRMPAVIPLLLQSLRDKSISNLRLAELISQDALLVAAVLRQVNSSFYRRSSVITSIEQALAVIGQNNLRLLVAEVAFRPVINVQSGMFTSHAAPRIWALSSRYSFASRRLSAERHVEAFEAFLAGLVQNVGMIVALKVMDQMQIHDGIPGSPQFCEAFARQTRAFARHIARQWEFPPAVLVAVGEEVTGLPAVTRSELGQVAYLSDRMAKIRLLADNGILDEVQAQAYVAGEDMHGCIACFQELSTEAQKCSGMADLP